MELGLELKEDLTCYYGWLTDYQAVASVVVVEAWQKEARVRVLGRVKVQEELL